jgi:hypothetical protein
MTYHTGPGHGEATLSISQEGPEGGRLFQSWMVCECTAEGLRAQLGTPAHESVATREATEAIGRAVLAQPGSVQLSGEPAS